jgi:hypothetical protein
VVYNNVHMMMYEADEAKREAWIASIDVVAAQNPKIAEADGGLDLVAAPQGRAGAGAAAGGRWCGE